MPFLLSVLAISVLGSGLLARPTQAEAPNSSVDGTESIGCLLNVAPCKTASTTGDQTVDQTGGKHAGQTTSTSPDIVKPTATLKATSTVAGGNVSDVMFTGTLTDETELASYVLSVDNGTALTVVKTATDLSGKTADMTYDWSVRSPNIVPSGQYSFTLQVTDKAGNTFSTAPVVVDVDNDPPVVAMSGGHIIKSGSISPTITANDAAHGVASYSWTADPGNPNVLSYISTDPAPTFTPTTVGAYIYYVDVADGLGNVARAEFDFSYAKELAIIPLPTADDPTKALVDQSPSTIPTTSQSESPSPQTGPDTLAPSSRASVLGATSIGTNQAPADVAAVADIAPTSSGWSIFGLLWYWWVLMIGALAASWLLIKKVVVKPLAKYS